MDYKTSGVDVEAGRAFIKRIRSNVESTHRKEVIGGLGGFGGLIRLPVGISRPVLVAGTDGVGTKLELAQKYERHYGVGLDLVAMCVNDVITSAAEPLFFLDYIATGSLGPNQMAEVVKGIAEGCRVSGCALLGGETAEMPGFYPSGRYDLAGFCVAVAEENNLINGSKIKAGDQIIGVASSGVHSNGFSLVRQVLATRDIDEQTTFGSNQSLVIDTLLAPTKIYVQLVKALIKAEISLHGMAHITGGGLPENLPRCLPEGVHAFVDKQSWRWPEIFKWLQTVGQIPERDLWHTFNLGVGFCLIVSDEATTDALEVCAGLGFEAWPMGWIDSGTGLDGNALQGLPR